jgi:hypothetical protein
MIISLRRKQDPLAKVGKASTRYALVLPMVVRPDGRSASVEAFGGAGHLSSGGPNASKPALQHGLCKPPLCKHCYQPHRATSTLLPFIAQEARDMGSIIRVFPALGVRREFAASSRRWRTCTPVDVLQANDIVLVELAEGDLEDPYSRLPDNTKTVGRPAGYENPLPGFRPEDPIT